MKRGWIVLALLLAACGDSDKKPTPDSGMQPSPDAMVDAGGEMATLTSYVIDLITNNTSSTVQPRPYSEFQSLSDPDTGNATAYSSLF